MAEFTFNIPDEQISQLIEGLCVPAGLDPTIENTRTRAIDHIRVLVNDYFRQKAAAQAAAAVESIEIS